jgi:hypothetical protein
VNAATPLLQRMPVPTRITNMGRRAGILLRDARSRPHEDLIVGGMFGWVSDPALKQVEEYLETVKKYPNPPAPNITQFHGGRG